MLYLFSGDDTKNKLEAYDKFSEDLPKDAEVFLISHNDFDKHQIETLYSGSGLFSSKNVVVFSGVLDREETREFSLSKLDDMSKSDSYFIFIESKLTKAITDMFKKARAEINVFELPKAKLEKFDNFLLADAFGVRNKLNLWIYFRQAVTRGVGLEELTGVLFWKAKDMLTKKSFGKYSQEELENFTKKIAYILPEARSEGRDAEVVLERFLLEVS